MSEKTIIQRMAAVRDDFAGGLEKSAASKLGYQYHSIEALMDRVRPLFVKHGVLMEACLGHSYSPQPAGRIAATVTVTFFNVDNREDFLLTSCFVDVNNSGRSDGKGAGIAMSYGVKNILLKMLNVGSGDEDPESLDVDKKEIQALVDKIKAEAKKKLGRTAGKQVQSYVKEKYDLGFANLNLDQLKEVLAWTQDLPEDEPAEKN